MPQRTSRESPGFMGKWIGRTSRTRRGGTWGVGHTPILTQAVHAALRPTTVRVQTRIEFQYHRLKVKCGKSVKRG